MHVWILLLGLWPGPSDCPFPVPLLCRYWNLWFSKSHFISSTFLPAKITHCCGLMGLPLHMYPAALSWLRRLAWRSSQGWCLWLQEEFCPPPPPQMYGGYGLPCPWGILGSGTLCSRPAPVITLLLGADSSCRDQWKTSWVANLDSSLGASWCFLESNVLMYKAVAPAVFAGLDKSRNACTLYLSYRAGFAL